MLGIHVFRCYKYILGQDCHGTSPNLSNAVRELLLPGCEVDTPLILPSQLRGFDDLSAWLPAVPGNGIRGLFVTSAMKGDARVGGVAVRFGEGIGSVGRVLDDWRTGVKPDWRTLNVLRRRGVLFSVSSYGMLSAVNA